MAQQLGGDSKLAAATIAVTTALAIPSIAVMLLLLDG
jgi:predicted permease